MQECSTGATTQMMLSTPNSVQLEPMPINVEEENKIDRFYLSSCGCLKSCITQFPREHVMLTSANATQLLKSDLDMVILGQLMACTHYTQAHNTIDEQNQCEPTN